MASDSVEWLKIMKNRDLQVTLENMLPAEK